MECVIETKNLVKNFGYKAAVKNVSMKVARGDIYGLIGKNGAGKTTLMKLLLGLTFPTSGSLRLFGSDDVNLVRAGIGSLVEIPGLYTGETAYENLKRFAILTGSTEEEIRYILKLIGLENTGAKKVGAFSLGMKQRLGIGIALLGNPEMLVLDEPINGLDPAGIKDVRDLILELNSKGVTVLISSHLLDELGKIATKYGIMRDGELVVELTPDEIAQKCRMPLELGISDSTFAKDVVCELYPDADVEENNGKLFVYKDDINPAELNRALVERGFEVSELKHERLALEDFFIKMMG
ncbi:MAG: ATP-binding cassette domain-containing protein [Ruminococcaceae bacterium]|nr:ATP-binding cassette domain-containing protein [Oscillospiraceae bacterium]